MTDFALRYKLLYINFNIAPGFRVEMHSMMLRPGIKLGLIPQANSFPLVKGLISLRPIVPILTTRNLCNLTRSSSPIAPLRYSQANYIKFNRLLPGSFSRNFHFTSANKSGRYPFGNKPPVRVFRISPLVLFLASIGTLTLFFLVLPFMLTFFLPLLVVGISVYQFRKWKNNTLFEQLLNGLKKTEMKLSSQTLNAMYVKSVSKYFDAARNPNAGVFEEIFKGVDEKMKRDGIWPSANNVSEADKLVSFVQSRVMEAIKGDEQGIRTYFLGNDVSNWIKEGYDFELGSSECRSFVRGFKDEIIFWLVYPIYLKSSTHPKRHLADVSVAVLQGHHADRNKYDFFLMQTNLIRQNAKCNMVISVKSTSSILPRQFVIIDGGESGDFWTKYDVHEDSDGHTEYTIKTND
ncbi:hypothetical protein ZYGR_0AG01990 [Zygosaccharomyces rouxii]|uniref:Uncharacterized protein n=1 Tax=Zygosaccharomyces rouxii TaxID=4956 RepID=A0A1Q3A951_ZYGRO|nr:hypothetical protein ZYGR_0AG01990 [Zygosaccharomyces rouxii]